MPTKRLPTLNGSDDVFDKHIPATMARTSAVIATSTIDAASGIAGLTAAAGLKIAGEHAGGVILVRWDSVTGWPATRPTARTDITVWCEAPSTIAPQASWATSGPAWMLVNDRFEIRDANGAGPLFGSPPSGVALASVNYTTGVRSISPYAWGMSETTYGEGGEGLNSASHGPAMIAAFSAADYRQARFSCRLTNPVDNTSIILSGASGVTGSVETIPQKIRDWGGRPIATLKNGDPDAANVNLPNATNIQALWERWRTVDPAMTWFMLGNEPDGAGHTKEAYTAGFVSAAKALKTRAAALGVPMPNLIGPNTASYSTVWLQYFIDNAVDTDGTALYAGVNFHHYAMGTTYSTTEAALAATTDWANEVAWVRAALVTKWGAAAGNAMHVGVGEFNWSWRVANGYPSGIVAGSDDRFYKPECTVWAASVNGHIAYQGGEAFPYGSKNGALGIVFEKSADATTYSRAKNDPMPIYFGTACWTGGAQTVTGPASHSFRHFGTQFCQATTGVADLEVFASADSKNIVLINKSTTTDRTGDIGLTGVTAGTFDKWSTDRTLPFSPMTKAATAAFSNGWIPAVTVPRLSVVTIVLNP